jgi:hypothetical protein
LIVTVPGLESVPTFESLLLLVPLDCFPSSFSGGFDLAVVGSGSLALFAFSFAALSFAALSFAASFLSFSSLSCIKHHKMCIEKE